jgi:hypothetical protein
MSKTLDQLSIEDIIKETLEQRFQDYDDNFEHETMPEYAPWGNSYARVCSYITEDSQIKCEEAFKQDFDVDDFIVEYLAENQDFRDKIVEMVNKHAF